MYPLFSIIVPIYNVDRYLRECLNSVLNQNIDNFEVVLVDDGSPDTSPTICDEYAAKDSRFKVIHKHNEGLVRARQDGVNLASGDYVICLDSDDWLHQNNLKILSNIIKSFKPDIICTGYYKFDGKNNIKFPFPFKEGYYDRQAIEKEIFPLLIESKYS